MEVLRAANTSLFEQVELLSDTDKNVFWDIDVSHVEMSMLEPLVNKQADLAARHTDLTPASSMSPEL